MKMRWRARYIDRVEQVEAAAVSDECELPWLGQQIAVDDEFHEDESDHRLGRVRSYVDDIHAKARGAERIQRRLGPREEQAVNPVVPRLELRTQRSWRLSAWRQRRRKAMAR
jgi:hypothetical protein